MIDPSIYKWVALGSIKSECAVLLKLSKPAGIPNSFFGEQIKKREIYSYTAIVAATSRSG